MNNIIGVQDIIKAMSVKGHIVFEDDSKPFNLNIIGIRSDDDTPNVFNDLICFMWKYKGQWSLVKFKATTDPGTYWLNNPMNTEGTAIVKPGQYRGLWKLGKHQGKYLALKQIGSITIYRDNNKDDKHDYNSPEETGIFGINLHHAGNDSTQIDKWSAGCAVIGNINEWEIAISIITSSATIWGDSFSYSILNEKDL